MLAFRTLRPLLNRVVVKKAEALTKTKGGIILTSKNEERLNFGTVMAVGPGKTNDDGSVRATLVQVGDTVLLPEYGGSKDVDHHLMDYGYVYYPKKCVEDGASCKMQLISHGAGGFRDSWPK